MGTGGGGPLAELFVVDGRCGGTVFLLSGERSVVGRSPDCEVSIPEPWVSSRHALFERRGDELWLVDLDSRNGTWLGDQRVREARLRDGDKVGFGRTNARVRIPAARPAASPAAVGATLVRKLVDQALVSGPAAVTTGSGQRQVA